MSNPPINLDEVREAVRTLRLATWGPIWGPSLDVVLKAVETVLPKTKTLEAWHVEYVHRDGDSVEMNVTVRCSKEEAEARAQNMRGFAHYDCIRVTGPHQHMVPA